MADLSILERMSLGTPVDLELRCERCGCGLDATAISCSACGMQRAARAGEGSSAGALGDRRYAVAPLPAASYDIALGPSESLAATFKLWSENLPRLGVLGFIPYILMLPLMGSGLFVMFMPDVMRGLEDMFEGGWDAWWPLMMAGGTAVGALMVVLTLASTAACVHLIDEKTQGVDVTAGAALLASFRHVGWLFCAATLMGTLAIVGMAAPIAPLVWGMSEDSYTIAALALPALLVTAGVFVLTARLVPVMPVIVVEDTDVVTALGRAWHLTSGRTAQVALAVLLFGFAYFGVTIVVSMIGIVPILGALVQMFANAILVPLCYVFAFVVYAGCVRASQPPQR
jgi:hypothetical protein